MRSSPGLLVLEVARVSLREHRLIGQARGGYEAGMGEPDKVAAMVDTSTLLGRLGIAHALIGGVAVGIHSGVPRATIDTDFAVSSQADRREITTAMTTAGFVLVGDFPHSTNFRHRSTEPVQLAFDPVFDPMLSRAITIDAGGHAIPVVNREDLIRMKELAANDPGRRKSKALRDLADIALLRGDVGDPDEGW